RRPGMKELAARLRQQTREVAALLKEQNLDFTAVQGLRDALGEVSQGLDSLARNLDPSGLKRLASSLGDGATFLDKELIPGATDMADKVEKAGKELRQDAAHMVAFLRSIPPDLKPLQEVHESLDQFGKGLEKLSNLLQPERVQPLLTWLEAK